MRILCVCRGNTCRSPMAQAVIAQRFTDRDMPIVIDSAGTDVAPIGAPPDPRGVAAVMALGLDTTHQRSRQVTASDFDGFDLILALDRANLEYLKALPSSESADIRLLHPNGVDIPDPYEGGLADYEHALDMIETAADALIAEILAKTIKA